MEEIFLAFYLRGAQELLKEAGKFLLRYRRGKRPLFPNRKVPASFGSGSYPQITPHPCLRQTGFPSPQGERGVAFHIPPRVNFSKILCRKILPGRVYINEKFLLRLQLSPDIIQSYHDPTTWFCETKFGWIR